MGHRLRARIARVRWEPFLSWGAFVGGVVWDALTLQRIDRFAEQLTLLLLWGGSVAALVGVAAVRGKGVWAHRLHVAFILLAQFSLGGILSALSLFFFRSSWWSVSFVFVGVLVLLLLLNELLRQSYARLVPLWVMWLFASSALALLVVPTVWGQMGDTVVVVALLGVGGIGAVLGVLVAFLRHAKWREWVVYLASAIGVPLTVGVLYFANVVPPVPLVAREVGIYHHLWRDSAGYHLVYYERPALVKFLPGVPGGDLVVSVFDAPVYCFSSVFAPEGFLTTIRHRWQHRSPDTSDWRDVADVPIPLVGGRAAGYRGYSYVSASVRPGVLRCRVEDARGRLLGEARVAVQRQPLTRSEVLLVR